MEPFSSMEISTLTGGMLAHATWYTANANGKPDTSSGYVTIPVPPYNGAIRDMAIAPDKSGIPHLWGGTGTTTLYKMDAGMNVKAQFTITGADFRAIAYDPVSGGFWSADFSGQATCYGYYSALKGTSSAASAIASKYGMAWTSSSYAPPVNALWVWSQQEILTAVDVGGDVVIGTYTFTQPGTQGPAGGAEVCIVNGEYVLLLNFQNLAIGCYFIAVVPVELTSFTATTNGNSVILNWSTATETNNQGFEIERSHNGMIETVGFVAGFGTTNEPRELFICG
ncbi:MAG: hypothetical protein U5J96_01270 [Ignavibacteriaceae bacterium]|nr:hypothetical protein [Ignavibacteriaceae bacterium]